MKRENSLSYEDSTRLGLLAYLASKGRHVSISSVWLLFSRFVIDLIVVESHLVRGSMKPKPPMSELRNKAAFEILACK